MDMKRAITLYTIAADAGLSPAQYNLGVLYATGANGSADIEKAYDLFSKAADQGHELAKENLETLKEVISDLEN